MSPVDRVTKFLAVAGIERPAEKTIDTAKGKQTVLVQIEDRERGAAYAAAAERVIKLLDEAEQARDLTIGAARLALERAIVLGEFLVEMAELFSGNFDEWLEGYCADRLSRSTAFRYMKAVRYRNALGDDCPDFATLKELYVAAGLLPPPASNEGDSRPSPPLFRLRFESNVGDDPAQWEPVVRRDFIQRAKPIADLLEKAIAAEEAT